MSTHDDSGFLARWSQRKVQARRGGPVAEEPPAALPATADTLPDVVPAAATAEPQPTPPPTPPTMDEVAALTPASDFSRFVASGVEPGVKNAALKKLFTDPHFNLMDGLDTYIEDFGRADPLPASMLAQMAQARFLGLFAEPEADHDAAPPAPDAGPAPSAAAATDEDPDLRLQPHDAAGRPGPEPGSGGHTGRQP